MMISRIKFFCKFVQRYNPELLFPEKSGPFCLKVQTLMGPGWGVERKALDTLVRGVKGLAPWLGHREHSSKSTG